MPTTTNFEKGMDKHLENMICNVSKEIC